MPRIHRTVLLALALLASLSSSLSAQDAPTTRVNREQMWFAPTAEDWAKPCLIRWQRTWEDAQAVSKETGKPILICVNMDGEIASEHYAGVRYRRPETAGLYDAYTCVIASTYRHTPRDHDEQGRRIPCPRFGTVTCGEHISIEPFLFERYFEGVRVAPRHIMLGDDGKEAYDVYYAWDTDSVFKAIKDGVADRPKQPPINRADRPVLDRVLSRESSDREAVESAFLTGDKDTRAALLKKVAEAGGDANVDLLRLGVFSLDAELAKASRESLAKSTSESAVELISDAMRTALPPDERNALMGALDRMGGSSDRARTLSVVHRGLSGRSPALDAASWTRALEGAAPEFVDEAVVADTVARAEAILAAKDADALVGLAAAHLHQATSGTLAAEASVAALGKARASLSAAAAAGASGWRPSELDAAIAWYEGEVAAARKAAEAAMAFAPIAPESWNAMLVLGLFTEARQQAILRATRRKEAWPGEWLADVHAAYAILAKHPFGNADQVAGHYDFLKWLGAKGQAFAVLETGILKFPNTWALHDRYRSQLVEDRGPDGMEAQYATLIAERDASTGVRTTRDVGNAVLGQLAAKGGGPRGLETYAAFGSIIAAEAHRKANAPEKAVASYERALALCDRAMNLDPLAEAAARRFMTFAFGGIARIRFETNDFPKATDAILAAFDASPPNANELDGMNLSAVDTAKQLLTRVKDKGMVGLASRIDAGLAKLDPKQLELPAYERGGPASRPQRAASRPARRRNG